MVFRTGIIKMSGAVENDANQRVVNRDLGSRIIYF